MDPGGWSYSPIRLPLFSSLNMYKILRRTPVSSRLLNDSVLDDLLGIYKQGRQCPDLLKKKITLRNYDWTVPIGLSKFSRYSALNVSKAKI